MIGSAGHLSRLMDVQQQNHRERGADVPWRIFIAYTHFMSCADYMDVSPTATSTDAASQAVNQQQMDPARAPDASPLQFNLAAGQSVRSHPDGQHAAASLQGVFDANDDDPGLEEHAQAA